MTILRIFLSFIFLQSMITPAGVIFADSASEMTMVVGDVQTIPVNNLTRVSVTSPEVADISDAQNDKVVVLAKKAGQTAVFLWDEDGKHTVTVSVAGQDLRLLKERISHLLQEADVKTLKLEANAAEGKVVISGVLDKDKKNVLDKIIDPYGDQIINLVKDEISDELIQIDMQITELSTTLDKKLGFDWAGGSAGSDLTLNYNESGIPMTGGSKNWLKFGQFNRTTAIVDTLNLMIKEGKARDLSRPRILVSSGKEATINVGGEIPIQSTTTNASGGSTQTNITFKKYGVILTVTPMIKGGNKIDVTMNLKVSDIDKTFHTSSTTNDIAFKTRSAQTQLLLDDRQTVVFAGLIRYTDSEQNKRVPFLGKIPVVGLLFRSNSKAAPDEGKELVITLTPTIMRSKEYAVDQMKLPTKALKEFSKEMDQKHDFEREPIPGNSDMQTPVKVDPVPVTPYVRSIQMKISQSISYPSEAVRNNWQGTVKLKLRILKDGSLADAAVAQSSGHDVFDKDALTAAKNAAPYGPFSSEIKGEYLNLTLPVVYTQGNAYKPDAQTVVASY